MKWSIFPRKFLWFLIVTLYLIVASASLPSIFVSVNKAPTIANSSPFLLEAAYWFSSFFMCSFHCFTRSLIHLNSKNRSHWTPKEIFTGMSNLFLWGLVEVGMKINRIGSLTATFLSSWSVYFCNNAQLLRALGCSFCFLFLPCFWGLDGGSYDHIL